MRYIVKVTDDSGTPSWKTFDAPQIPSWTDDRKGHVDWWDEHVRPLVTVSEFTTTELEIVMFADEDYTVSTEDTEAVGIDWEF